jgi:hypothetical protein
MENTESSIQAEKAGSLLEDDTDSKTERSPSPSSNPGATVDPAIPEDKSEVPVAAAEWEYIKGFNLFAVVAVITLACFLLFLDTSIVATVNPARSLRV